MKTRFAGTGGGLVQRAVARVSSGPPSAMLAGVRHLPTTLALALAAGASLAAPGCENVRMPKLSLRPSTPVNEPVAEDPALAQARAEHAEARRRVAELERRVVESEERLRV